MQGIRTRRKKSMRKSEPLQILIVSSKFKLTLMNPLKNGDWLIYHGTEIFKNIDIIGFLKEKSEENNDKWKLNKPKEVAIYHPSFCFQELERDVVRVKEKQMQVIIFQKHGVSLFEVLSSLGKIKANVLHLLILLFVRLLKKIHAQSLTLTSLSFKNVFIVWANIEAPCLYLCNNSILKRNIIGNNNPSEKQKENNSNNRRGSCSKSPNNFRPSRRQSRLSINKGKIHKRENVQIVLTKLTEIENDWNVMANANKKQRGCFEDIIKYISKESLDISEEEYKFDKWVNEIKKIIGNSGIDLEEANNILLKNSKEILNLQYKNRTVSNLKKPERASNEIFFMDLSKKKNDGLKTEEDYQSIMNEGHQGLDENMKSHILTPFQNKKHFFEF